MHRHIEAEGATDAIHANYWLSGVVGHALKHQLDIPLVCTFHTLARVKADTGDPEPARRIEAESGDDPLQRRHPGQLRGRGRQLTEFYGADRRRVEIVPPGVDHAFFSPGDRRGARPPWASTTNGPCCSSPAASSRSRASTSPSARSTRWSAGTRCSSSWAARPAPRARPTRPAAAGLVAEAGLADRVVFRPPQPHHLLSSYYRAADVCLVPSRSESFGLVALEAAACGTPVVAAAVGGLTTLVDHGRTGLLVEERAPAAFAAAVDDAARRPGPAPAP